MSRSPVLQEAQIKPEVIRYHMTGIAILLTITVFGILLIPIVLPLAYWGMSRYYERLRVVLTRRDLKVHRGIFQREEKSIPLEKITDLAVYQGPLMRAFALKGIRIETAGQSSEGALVTVVGIDGVDEFRDAVLDQRDRVSERDEEQGDSKPASFAQPANRSENAGTMQTAILAEMRDALVRIEKQLGKR